MAIGVLGSSLWWNSDGAAERGGGSDGAGACWGRRARCESCCAGEGYWVCGAELWVLLGEERGRLGVEG